MKIECHYCSRSLAASGRGFGTFGVRARPRFRPSEGRTKMFTEEFLAPFLTLFGEYDRFGLAHRIEDHSLLVQMIHRIPVVSFPCTSAVMDCQEEKCEHHL